MALSLTDPCPGAIETDSFGLRSAIYNASGGLVVPAQLHDGQDYAAPTGTPVYAAHTGTVRAAGWEPLAPAWNGTGNTVKIGSAQCSTTYMHLARVDVSPGQYVTAGQQIGTVGSTGNSTGPHLHFKLELPGGPVDPLPYLKASTTMALTDTERKLLEETHTMLREMTKTGGFLNQIPEKVTNHLLETPVFQHGPEGEKKSIPVRDVLGKTVPLIRRCIAWSTKAANR